MPFPIQADVPGLLDKIPASIAVMGSSTVPADVSSLSLLLLSQFPASSIPVLAQFMPLLCPILSGLFQSSPRTWMKPPDSLAVVSHLGGVSG